MAWHDDHDDHDSLLFFQSKPNRFGPFLSTDEMDIMHCCPGPPKTEAGSVSMVESGFSEMKLRAFFWGFKVALMW